MQLFPQYKSSLRQLLTDVALGYFQKEQFDLSAESFAKALEHFDSAEISDAELYYHLARCALVTGKFEKADEFIKIAKEKKLSEQALNFLLAERKFFQGDMGAALEIFRRVSQVEPGASLTQIIILAQARMQWLDGKALDNSILKEDIQSYDPPYRNYAKVLQAELLLQEFKFERVLALTINGATTPVPKYEMELLHVRAAVEQLDQFDLNRTRLENFVRDNGKEKLEQYLKIVTSANNKPCPNTIVFIFFARLVLKNSFLPADFEQLEKALEREFKNNDDIYPAKFALRLKAEMLQSEKRNTEAARAFFEAGKQYYFEGHDGDKFGEPLFERSRALDPNLVENYWYYSDAAYINSFIKEKPIPDSGELLRAEKMWLAGFAKDRPSGNFTWAYFTRARVEERKGLLTRQFDNEVTYRALFYSLIALLFEPQKPEWQIASAQYFNDVGLMNNAFDLANKALKTNPSNVGAKEEVTRCLLNTGDFEAGEQYIRELEEMNSSNQALYYQWTAFIRYHQRKNPEVIDLLKRVLATKGNENNLWSRQLLMLLYWTTEGYEKECAGMADWITGIENDNAYSFRENELAFAKLVRGDVKNATKDIKRLLGNEAFEPFASTIGVICFLQQQLFDECNIVANKLLSRQLTFPELNEAIILLEKFDKYSVNKFPEHSPAIHRWLFNEDSGFMNKLQKKLSSVATKVSPDKDTLQKDIRWELENNDQCKPGSWGYMAMKLSEAVNYYIENEKEQALSALQQLKKESKEFPLSDEDLTTLFTEPEKNNVQRALQENTLGNDLYKLAKFEEAVIHYKEAISLDPTVPVYFRNLGLMFNELKQWNNSLEAYQNALRLDPDDAETNNCAGIACYMLGQQDNARMYYNKAIEFLGKADDKAKTLSIYWSNIALTYLAEKNWVETQRTLEISLKLVPGVADNENSLGNALFHQGYFDQAISHYHKAIELDPDNSIYYENVGLSFRNLGNTEEAKKFYEVSLKLNPRNDFAMNELANFKFDKSDFRGARELYNQATLQNPKNSVYQSNLGRTYYEENNYAEAESYFRKAIELDDKNAYAWNFLGNIAFASVPPNYEDALQFYSKAKTINPSEAYYFSNCGLALFNLGKNEEAEEYFREALLLNPRLSDSYNGLGLVSCSREDYITAANQFSKAVEFTPGNKTYVANVQYALGLIDEQSRKKLISQLSVEHKAEPLQAVYRNYN